MNNLDIRWLQRFKNFSRAYGLLREALGDERFDIYADLELEGVVQRFEYTFELGWKLWKDYLEYSGVKLREATPRAVIRECAERNVFGEAGVEPNVFLEMMLARNALSHKYDLEYFREVTDEIKERYAGELEKEHTFFTRKERELERLGIGK